MSWIASNNVNDIGSNTADLIKFFAGFLFTAIGWLFNRLVKHWDELKSRLEALEEDNEKIKLHIGLEAGSQKEKAIPAKA